MEALQETEEVEQTEEDVIFSDFLNDLEADVAVEEASVTSDES